MWAFIKRLSGSKKTNPGLPKVEYRSAEFYEMRDKLIESLPKPSYPKVTVKQLAKCIVENKIGPLQIDAHLQQLFPDFGKFFSSEQEAVAIDFVKQYLPECRINVKVSNNEVQIFRDERLPGAGLYPHLIGYAHITNSLPASILAAALFAYDYLSS